MTLRVKLELAAAAVVLIGLVIGFRAWLAEHDNRLKAESAVTAQQQAQAQIATQIKSLDDQQRAYQQAQDAKLTALQGVLLSLKTPQQQVAWSQQQLVDAIKGIQISVNPATGQAVATIPAASIPDLPKAIEECKECTIRLQTATEQLQAAATRENLMTQTAKSKDEQIASLQASLKGGTWIQRVHKDSKLLVEGGAIALIVVCALGHCK